ncbi:hypothetical protein L593_11075 [Salinarchaeum sp. Harcht-Bsk1]|nr:hypothetical protein L593_11075 [Salinarchaeum sp. Harcht-Bsk1]
MNGRAGERVAGIPGDIDLEPPRASNRFQPRSLLPGCPSPVLVDRSGRRDQNDFVCTVVTRHVMVDPNGPLAWGFFVLAALFLFAVMGVDLVSVVIVGLFTLGAMGYYGRDGS